jgi:serine/threonine-protein kinase
MPPAGQIRLPGSCDNCGATGVQGPLCPRCGAPIDPIPGAILAGRYRVDVLLGEGGFGRVYRGVDLPTGVPVAVKFLKEEVAAQPDFRARFQREAMVLSRLRSPGIVAVYAFGEHAGLPYLVMEFVHGRPLSRLLKRNEIIFPPVRAASILDQVVGILEVAHASGVVHRDVKPGNVMITTVPVAPVQPRQGGGSTPPPPLLATTEAFKLLDFGLAFFEETPPEERVTSTRTTFGSPYYMSPEQCRGRDVGTPTDIYAAGIMLFELLSGAPPFLGGSASEVAAKHMYVPPPPVVEHGACQPVPAEIENVARWALSKRPEDRPTATAFRAALAKAVQRVTASDRPQAARAGVGGEDTRTVTLVRAPSARAEGPRVVLWGVEDRRASALRDALAVNGIESAPWRFTAAPPEAAGHGAQAILIPGDGYAPERIRALRAQGGGQGLPVLVIDVPDAAVTPALIRAGASDVALAAVTDDVICGKVRRLIRRGR